MNKIYIGTEATEPSVPSSQVEVITLKVLQSSLWLG